jgi:hypothetical protein
MTANRTGERYGRKNSRPFLSRLVGNPRTTTGLAAGAPLQRDACYSFVLHRSASNAAMSDDKIAPRYAKAYRKGYFAGRTGAENPYEDDSREARAWIVGLLDMDSC